MEEHFMKAKEGKKLESVSGVCLVFGVYLLLQIIAALGMAVYHGEFQISIQWVVIILERTALGVSFILQGKSGREYARTKKNAQKCTIFACVSVVLTILGIQIEGISLFRAVGFILPLMFYMALKEQKK